jgi:uncharacterized protein (TIGR00251 family)
VEYQLFGYSLVNSFKLFVAQLMNEKNGRLDLREGHGFCTLTIKMIPRSSQNKVIGVENGALKLKLTAAPIEGEANKAVIDFLSKWLRKPKSFIELMKGQQSRHKLVRFTGLKAAEILEALQKLKIKGDIYG